jgi:tetratricopeptide (TPR) repeat protein
VQPSPRRKGRGLLVAVVVVLAVVALIFVGRHWWDANPNPTPPPPATTDVRPEDPRLTFKTPYRNVRPEVKYVGDAACAGCHESQARTYRDHPMSRSLAPLASATSLERYTEAARNPFVVQRLRYRVERRGQRAWHRETALDAEDRPIAENAAEVRFSIGSGRSGRAYLIDRGGYLFSSPITWYPSRGIWDLSPGYDKDNPHFARPISPDCLFCHANHADHVARTVNRYRPPIFRGYGIGCERCHGPGELHVRRHKDGARIDDLDDTIVNPARLEYDLRESVCQQCHLQGQARVLRRGRDTFDYRPGLPFHLFMSEFVRPIQQGGTLKFAGSVEQMHASRCFQKSAGRNKMGCTSCHDAHAVPAEENKNAFYRQRCLNCHKERGCSLPAADRRGRDDNCIACHMERTGSDVNHTAITDHRLLRRPDRARPADDPPRPAQVQLLHFHRHLADAKDPDGERDLAIALVRLADRQGSDAARALTEKALPLLESALRRDRTDLPAWEARGNALWFQGRLEDAEAAFATVLAAAPEREPSLFLAASLALRLKRAEQARGHAERLLQVNPWRWRHHLLLGQAHGQAGNWSAAIRACRQALDLDPVEPAARQLLVLAHLRSGEQVQARREFATMLALHPPQAEELRRWFAEEMRRTGR